MFAFLLLSPRYVPNGTSSWNNISFVGDNVNGSVTVKSFNATLNNVTRVKRCLKIDDLHSPKTQTYAPFGTFSNIDFYDPDVRPFDKVPVYPNLIGLKLHFCTRNNVQLLTFDESLQISNLNFDENLKTKMIIHGFNSGPTKVGWIFSMAEKILEYQNVNVIIADWSQACLFPDYIQVYFCLIWLNIFMFDLWKKNNFRQVLILVWLVL